MTHILSDPRTAPQYPRRRAASRRWSQAAAAGLAVTLLAGSVHAQPSGLGPKEAPSDGGPLSGEAIRTLLAGNALVGGYGAQPYTFFFEPGGVLRGTLGSSPDSGNWTVKEDRYCHEWNEFFEGVTRCYRVYNTGDGYLFKNADAYRYWDITGKLRPGRPPGY